MRSLLTALASGLLLASASGCLGLQARPAVPALVLKTPEPPSRLVLPPPPVTEPFDPAPVTPPGGTAVVTSPPPPPPPATRPPDRSAPPPAARTTGSTTDAPTVLQTTVNTTELERRAQDLLDTARRDLGKLNPATLPKEALAQYQWALQFAREADQLLKSRNFNRAFELADKAARLASLLAKTR